MAIPGSRRRMFLWAASTAGGFGQGLAGSAGALLVERIGGGASAAGLPQAVLVVGAALSALWLSRLASRAGRGVALASGAGCAAVGALVVVVGGLAGWLAVVLVGNLLLGAGTSTVMLGRYAAAELVAESARARAMAGVLVATTIGAVAGPNLLAGSAALARRLGLIDLTGPYLVGAAAFLLAGAVLGFGLAGSPPGRGDTAAARGAERDDLGPAGAPDGLAEPGWRGIRTSGRAGLLTGLAVLSLANLVMVAVMTMAPLQLHHAHGGLAAIGLLVSAHIAGMYAPSPVSGWITDRAGPAPTALLAGTVLVVACLWAAASGSAPALVWAMVLVGVGWNLSLLAGSALLTSGVPAERRPRREGWGEAGMGAAASVGGAASGVVMATGGYPLLAIGGAVVSALLVPVAWLAWSARSGWRLTPRSPHSRFWPLRRVQSRE